MTMIELAGIAARLWVFIALMGAVICIFLAVRAFLEAFAAIRASDNKE